MKVWGVAKLGSDDDTTGIDSATFRQTPPDTRYSHGVNAFEAIVV